MSIRQISSVLDVFIIGHEYDDPIRTIFSQLFELKPVPVMLINVPADPCVGVIDVTLPIVHGVKRNSSDEFDVGTVCEHELGSRIVLD